MSHPAVNAYLDAVCTQIRWREVHPAVRLELRSHIDDTADAHRAEGCAEAEALQRAVKQMGDPLVVGIQLDQTHQPRTDWTTILATLALVLVGIWAMYAVSVSASWGEGSNLFGGKLLWSAVGVAAGAAAFFLDYRVLRRFAWPVHGLALAALVAVWVGAPQVNGMPQYIAVTPLLFLPGLAALFSTWDWQRSWSGARALGVGALPALIYLMVPSLFALMEFALLFGLIIAGARVGRRGLLYAAISGLAASVVMAGRILTHPYQRDRLLAWLNPWQDPLGMGYQAVQSLQAIKGAGLWGQGATARLDLLPEVQTDFIFPYLIFTLGWAAGIAIGLLALLFLWRLLMIVLRVKDSLGVLLIQGILLSFALRFGWNILMTLGVMPVMGVELPFISHGGLLQVMNLTLVGMALSVFRRKDLARSPSSASTAG